MFPSAGGALTPVAMLLAALVGSGCSGGDSSGPAVVPPVITVSGVSDGAVVEAAVTIFVTIDGGTFEATLNGAPFFSGGTVADPGSYLLRVEARNAGGTSVREIGFEIRFSGESVLIVRMLDLGENGAGGGGDALLVTDSSAAGMRHALIDAGPAGADAADPGFVQRRLAQLGVDTLVVVVLTHAHSDHYGGMLPVINGVTVEEFVYNGQSRSLSSYEAVVSAANTRADVVTVPIGTESRALGLGVDRTMLTVIAGLPDNLAVDTNDGSDLNDGSVGTAVIKGDFRMFVTGDGEVDANLRWRTSFASLTGDLTVLKVGHHGANDAVFDGGFANSGTAWLDHAGAELHLVSSNGTSHPRIAALNALLGRPGATYCTSVHGEIELRATAAGQWTVSVARNADQDCVPGDEATS
jgi:competence protein ComEC